MIELKQIKKYFPNIEKPQQLANLCYRVKILLELLNDEIMPKTLIEYQISIIYDRLDKICDEYDLEPLDLSDDD